MSDSKPIAAFRKFIPIKTLAEIDALPERLTIAEIAELHPDGDDFARLLLAAHDVFLEHESARVFGPENCPPPDPKLGEGLRGESFEGRELLDIVLHFPREDPPWEPVPSVGDPRNALVIYVYRDDLKAWLEWVGLWPLPADALLNAWWPATALPLAPCDDPKPKDYSSRGPVLEQREQALKEWLIASKIPETDWLYLKSRHGLSLKKLYQVMRDHPAFKSQHGRGDPMTQGSFDESFWKKTEIAKLG